MAQRLDHSFLSSLQEKGKLLFRIVSELSVNVSINGSRTKASMRYCITPEPAQPYETAHLAASGKMMLAATASFVG